MASSSTDSSSKKRKRDDDRPRITYFASGRTFERLFKEESLEETKSVVRRKLGVPENSNISLAQIRGDQIIDLEDDDDFEAFSSLAFATMNMSVQVRVQKSNPQTPPSTEGTIQVPQVQVTVAQPEPPPLILPAAITDADSPAMSNAPEISTSAPGPLALTRRDSVSATPTATVTNEVDQPAPKRQKRATAKDRRASDHVKKSVSFAEPSAPASNVNVESIPPASGANNGQVEQSEVESTPPPAVKKKGKKKSDSSKPDAASAEIATEVQEPVVKKTRKSRASTAEVSNSTNSTAVPPTVPLTSDTAPVTQLEDPPVAPRKKSGRISQKKAKELPVANKVADSGGDQTPHDTPTSNIGPTNTTPKPKPKSSGTAKPSSQTKSPTTLNTPSPAATKAHYCPICLQAPHHLRFKCPVVKSPSLLEKRIQEMRSEPGSAYLLQTLEKLLQQTTVTPRSSTADKPSRAAPHTTTSSTPVVTTPTPLKPSAESTDKPSTKKASQKKPARAPSIDITLTSPPKNLDLANIDPNILLKGPTSKRFSIMNLMSSDSEEEDEGVQVLEQDDDEDVRPPRSRKRGNKERSSSDEEGDGAMDVDSSPDDVSFKTVDRLGQSVEMDMSPDNAVNERESLIPDIRTVSEDVVSAKDDSGKRLSEVDSMQKPLAPSVKPSQSSSSVRENASLTQSNGNEHTTDTTVLDTVTPKKIQVKFSPIAPQTRAEGTPKAAHAMKDRHGQLPPRTANNIPAFNAVVPEIPPLQPTPPPDLETNARRGKSKGVSKPPASNQTTKTKPAKAKVNGKSKMSIDMLVSRDSSFSTPQSTQDLSLAEWETLPVSPSLATDTGLDELDAGDLSYPPFTSTPLPNVGSTPLFLPSSSQVPLASQIRKIVAAESDDDEEEEVENTVRNHSRQSSRQTSAAYRRLTDIASQPLFTQELVVQPPRFAKGRIDKLKLYGSSQKDEEDSSSGSDSDSDEATPSHIPPSKRAGIAKTPR